MNTDKSDKPYWQPALTLMAEITGWIVAPILLALFIGRWLDQKQATEPLWFLIFTGLAFVITIWKIVQIGLNYLKDIEREAQTKKDDPSTDSGFKTNSKN